MELTIDNIISLLEKQGVGSKQLVLNLLKNANETQLTQLYQSVLFKIDQKRKNKCESESKIISSRFYH